MAQTTRSHSRFSRTPQAGGRFPRAAPPSGSRFGRPTPPASGRFSRSTPQATRSQRSTAAGRTRTLRRRKPQQSGVKKALAGMTGLLAGGKAAKSRRSSGAGKGRRAGGLALVAGAAGLAVKNRDKLAGMVRGGKSSGDAKPYADDVQPYAPTTTTPPTTTPPTATP
jgi:hypothetical protein